MAVYKETDCPFVYRIAAVERVVNGDTIDLIFDLDFDVLIRKRVRLLGIDAPVCRTDEIETVYGSLFEKSLKEWLYWAISSNRDDIEMEFRCPEPNWADIGELWINCTEDGHEFNKWTNVNKWLCEEGYTVGYWGQSVDDVKQEHLNNRRILAEDNVQDLLE